MAIESMAFEYKPGLPIPLIWECTLNARKSMEKATGSEDEDPSIPVRKWVAERAAERLLDAAHVITANQALLGNHDSDEAVQKQLRQMARLLEIDIAVAEFGEALEGWNQDDEG